ncbi:hypothetical protein C8Q79DRAFT_1112059 [Trametes meyenii]|nr:hypothetical protein C8Q79DRAFT_1112059 [Trametes meyenii]
MSTPTPDPASSPLLQDPTAPALVLSATPPSDPPPPYPSGRRTRQARTGRRRRTVLDSSEHSYLQAPSDEYDGSLGPLSVHCAAAADGQDGADADATETTPLLSPLAGAGPVRRRRTLSLTSTLRSSASFAPSFAQTVFSAFHPERDSDIDPDCREEDGAGAGVGGVGGGGEELEPELESPLGREYDPQQRAFAAELSGYAQRTAQRHQQQQQQQQLSFGARWRRYFRPLGRRAYYAALFHLVVVNFPYALVSWVFLFVFTLVGTCTLMALPLGAVLCFVDLLGARVLARGELALQTRYHAPLAHALPWPPLPIFTRTRAPTAAQLEAGAGAGPAGVDVPVRVPVPVPEGSFYRNAYALFTDATSYQALFYFLVLKPGVTVLMFLLFVGLVPLAAVLVVPLPAVLRLARRMGIWQANVAVEGLYFAAR